MTADLGVGPSKESSDKQLSCSMTKYCLDAEFKLPLKILITKKAICLNYIKGVDTPRRQWFPRNSLAVRNVSQRLVI
jgi:hypothetical protein